MKDINCLNFDICSGHGLNYSSKLVCKLYVAHLNDIYGRITYSMLLHRGSVIHSGLKFVADEGRCGKNTILEVRKKPV